MAIAKLSIDLEARIASLQEGLARATALNTQAVQGIERRWASLSSIGANFASGIKNALAGLALGAGASAFRSIIDGLDALNDAADATGSSIENLSALEDLAARTGTGFDTVTTALVRFNAALKEADGRNGVSQALKAIGVDAAELKRLDPAEALRRTAVALDQFANDGNRARVVQELFGKNVREIAPFLADLASAGKLNATVTREQAEQAEKFNQQLASMRKNVTDLSRTLSSDLVANLNRSTGEMRAALDVYGSFAAAVRGVGLEMLSDRFAGGFGDPLKKLNEAVGEMSRAQRQLDDIAAGTSTGGLATVLDLEEQLGKLRTKVEYYQRIVGLAEREVSVRDKLRAIEGATTITKPSIGNIINDTAAGFAKLQKVLDPTRFDVPFPGLTEALKRIQDTDVGKIARLQEELAALLFINNKDPDRPGLALSIAGIRGEIDKLTPAGQVAEQQLKRLTELLDASDLGQLNAQQKDFDLLLDFYSRGQISAEQYTSAVRKRFELANEAVRSHAETIGALEKEWERFGENIQRGFADTITKGLKGQFDSIEDLWKDLLSRMVAEAISAQFTQLLTGLIGFGRGGSSLGSGSLGAGVGANAASTVGMSQKGSGRGAGFTYAPTFNIDGGMNRSEVIAAATKVARESNRQLLESMQRGLIPAPSARP